MGIIKRQASKSTVTSLIGVIVSGVSAVFIIPMIPKEIYGMVSVIIAIASLLLPLTLIGLNSTVVRFSETINPDFKELFFDKLYLIHTLCSIAISSTFFAISPWFFQSFYPNAELNWGAGLTISLLIFLMGQFTMLSAYATTKYRLNVTRIAELIFQKAGIPLLLLALVFKVIPFALLLPFIILLYLFRAFSLWAFRYKTRSANHFTKPGKIISFWSYSIFAFFAVLMHQAIIDIDTLMVGSLVGIGEAGVYKYAFYIGMLVDLPRMNLVSLLFPLISKYQSQNDTSGIDSVYKRSSNLLFILGSFIIIAILPNLSDFFNIIPNGSNFEHSKYVIIFISASKLFNMVMGVNFEIIASSKKYYVILLINLITLGIVIISNRLLIPIYGISGAAFATLSVWIVYNFIAYLYLKIVYGFTPFSMATLKIIILLLSFLGAYYVIPIHSGNSIYNIVIRTLSSTLFLLICYKMSLSTDFNNQCIKGLRLLRLVK